MRKQLLFALILAGASASIGCVPPKVLISNSVQTKYLLQRADAQQGGKNVFNFLVRVCDGQGEHSTNCKDSIVLDNVIAKSVF
jgi:hypothetical protein